MVLSSIGMNCGIGCRETQCCFMTEGMRLHGAELLVYARIFGFCKLDEGIFYESKPNIAQFLGISERQAHRAVVGLVGRGLITESGEHVTNHKITKTYRLVDGEVERAVRITARKYRMPSGIV